MKKIAKLSTGAALAVVIPAILAGALLCNLVSNNLKSDTGEMVFIQPMQWFYLALIIFIVSMRIKQRRI